MTDLFSKTEFTYMYFIKNSQIYVFMFTISVLVLLSVAIIVFSRIRSKLEIEMYRNFIELSSHYTEQMIHEQTGIKELIHDMRNSLDDIKHLSQNKRYEELESEINIIKLLNGSKKVNENSYTTNIDDVDYLIKTSKDDNKISYIKYKDKLENDVEIKFSNVVQNGEISDEIFKFVVPEHYDVIRK